MMYITILKFRTLFIKMYYKENEKPSHKMEKDSFLNRKHSFPKKCFSFCQKMFLRIKDKITKGNGHITVYVQ